MAEISQDTTQEKSGDDVLLGVEQVQEMLGGVTKATIWNWRRRSEMAFPSPIQLGTRVFWWRSEIEQWLRSRPRG